jgi:alpha-tubulin suppressor-like RCC1 family protein
MRIALRVLVCSTIVLLLSAPGAETGLSPNATPTITAIAVGVDHTCALTSAGGVKCWGDNYNGALGDGTSSERHYPVDVVGLTRGVEAIAAGEYYTCAVTTAGGVKCWGYNRHGQLGDGTTVDRHAPVDVSGLRSGVLAIAAGATHACAVTIAGTVKCWGDNLHGQLGDGTTAGHRAAVGVKGVSDVSTITAGLDYTCAVTSLGAARCWGDNSFGKLGDGTTTDRDLPVGVSDLGSGVSGLSAADALGHTCALTSTGGVKCWGNNAFGELGNGTTTTRLTPIGVSGLTSGAVAVSAGGFYTCAITSAAGIACWGDNSDGALGDGTTTDRSAPVDVSGLTTGVAAVSAGLSHTCAVTTAGAVKCWGNNAFGELGDGTTADGLLPSTVGFGGCVVPNVVGKALARAAATIAKARCDVGRLTKKLSPARRKGYVLAQAPKPGRRLPAAARVNLTVGKGRR